MSAQSSAHNIQLVEIKPEERLAVTSELSLRRVIDGNKTGPLTYQENGREVLLKSRMRENLKSGSVRGLRVASGRKWL